MFIKIENDESHSALLCPKCGGNCLHQKETRVYTRQEEDGPATLVVAGRHTHVGVIDGAPGRRGVVDINFECENCGNLGLSLRVAQHKGQTLLSWSDAALHALM